MPSARLRNDACITSFWPRMSICVVIGRPLLMSLIAAWMSAAVAAQVAPVDVGGDVELALHRVVVDRFQAGTRIHRRDVGQPHHRRSRQRGRVRRGRVAAGALTGVLSRSVDRC